MKRFIGALGAAHLIDDVRQLVDALWLVQFLPARPPAATIENGAAPSFLPPPPAAGAGLPPADPPADAKSANVPVELPRRDAVRDAYGVYALDDSAVDGGSRARLLRVAGVPALREAHALARALRPLGKRRLSTRSVQLDEDATVERFAETGTLLACFTPCREHWFDALLLVEEMPALPLWCTLVSELEAMLSRQVGLRSLRRYALCAADGRASARSRSGALANPAHLLEGSSPLALVVSDGTSSLWRDGGMATTLAAIGLRAPLAVLQLLPERLWPNTALGAADWRVSSPRAGAANRELRSVAPSWMEADDAPGVTVPIVALQPLAFAQWAHMLMGRSHAQARAGILWPDADDGTPAVEAAQPVVKPAPPEQLVARLRSVAGPRVLQAAVHLSAAAPLTLAVVRLVQGVMQPHAASEDLPLLLLSGLLVRRAGAMADASALGEPAGDDRLVFDFADGARELLQRSLLRHEAERIRRAVSSYIAERVGLPVSFSALVEHPHGDVVLPDWARPFAEVGRQIDRLFNDAGQQPNGGERIDEVQLAPGVTVRATLGLLPGVQQLAYAPDGARLAVRHDGGVALFRLLAKNLCAGEPQREPVTVRRPPSIMFIRGWGLEKSVHKEIATTTRALLGTMFQGGDWKVEHHYTTFQASEIRELVSRLHETGSVVCMLGVKPFVNSTWARTLRSRLGKPWAKNTKPVLLLQLCRLDDRASGCWQLEISSENLQLQIDGTPQKLAMQLALQVQARAGAWLHDVAFGAHTVGLTWQPASAASSQDAGRDEAAEPRLLVFDSQRRRIVREGQPPSDESVRPAAAARSDVRALHSHPLHSSLALVTEGRLYVNDPPAGSSRGSGNTFVGTGTPAFAWSPSGDRFALAWPNTEVRVYDDLTRQVLWHRRAATRQDKTARLLAWDPTGKLLAVTNGDANLLVIKDDGGLNTFRHHLPRHIDSLAWSPDGRYVAVATDDAVVRLLAHDRPDAPPLAEWRAESVQAGQPTVVAFSPAPLDGVFHELAVGHGDRVQLLRIDPAVLAAAAAASAPSSGRVSEHEEDDGDEWIEAALSLLQSMALAFHVGGLLPDRQRFSQTSMYEQLGSLAGEPRNALAHWMRMSEYVFQGPVQRLLVTGEDPIVHADTAAARQACLSRLEDLREEVKSARSHGAVRLVQPAGWLEVASDLLQHSDPVTFNAIDGHALRLYLSSLRHIIYEPGRPKFSVRQPRKLRKLEDMLTSMVHRELAVKSLSRYCTPFYEPFATDGMSDFTRCTDYLTYLSQLMAFWKDTSRQLFESTGRKGTPAIVSITAPVRASHLHFVIQAVPTLGYAIRIGNSYDPLRRSRRPQHTWSVTLSGYVDLIDRLSEVMLRAVRQRLQRPPRRPMVLWVDDRPYTNTAERSQLERYGIAFETATSTDAALSLLCNQPFDAVISDMSRPSDPHAGYTLLDALRAAGHDVPYIIYASASVAQQEAQARARGALGSTDDPGVLTDLLIRVLRRA